MAKYTGKDKVIILEDSILAGVLLAKGHTVTPRKESNDHVVYCVGGNVEKSLQEIYSNCPIGALDVVRSIKLTRSMIFSLRGQR